MRDAHRIKDSVELSLDNRHVVGLTASALLVLALVFASGVLVGKRLAGTTAAREPADMLAALDQKLEGDKKVMEAARGEELGFQEKLTQAAAVPAVVPPPAPPPAPPAPARKPETALASAVAPAAPAPRPLAAPPPPEPAGVWTVQVAATQQKTDADRRAAELRARGLSPSVTSAQVAGKGRYWRVQVGRFHSREDAERYKNELARQGGFQAFVTRVGP